MTQKLLGNKSKGMLFILSAPAGTGKTTLIERLTQEFSSVVMSISFTTRRPRPQEVNGVHYNFVDTDTFEKMIAAGDFLEYVQLYGDYYGTSRQWVELERLQGKHVVLVIDTQGAAQLNGEKDTVFIFVAPPSLEELRERLMLRQTEPVETIEKRLAWAHEEMRASSHYDYVIVNDDLETAYQVLKSVLIAEEHKNP